MANLRRQKENSSYSQTAGAAPDLNRLGALLFAKASPSGSASCNLRFSLEKKLNLHWKEKGENPCNKIHMWYYTTDKTTSLKWCGISDWELFFSFLQTLSKLIKTFIFFIFLNRIIIGTILVVAFSIEKKTIARGRQDLRGWFFQVPDLFDQVGLFVIELLVIRTILLEITEEID